MKSNVAERNHSAATDYTEPVRAYGVVAARVGALAAGEFELNEGAARVAGFELAGLNVGESLLGAALDLVPVDSTSLKSGWAWSRPGNELATLGDNCESVLGFEINDCAPAGFEAAKWVDDLDSFFVELDSWLNKEEPGASREESYKVEHAEPIAPIAREGRANEGHNRNGGNADDCKLSYAWTNDVHSDYYPSEQNESHHKCEDK